MDSIIDWMDSLVEKFWDKILDFLPGDPFTEYIYQLKYGTISQYLGYINYFFPVKFLLGLFFLVWLFIIQLLLSCVGLKQLIDFVQVAHSEAQQQQQFFVILYKE